VVIFVGRAELRTIER